MAFDGITTAGLVAELNRKIKGGRITKIQQPEKDEIILVIKADDTFRLFISANASLPLIYLTDDNKTSPATAPAFCMLLRKHFGSAKIREIRQGAGDEPSLERMIDITVEHFDEMGDLKEKHLITEIMGKHSNIILCDESYKIVDSIKRVSGFVSSVREVLPGRDYFLPKTVDKLEPLNIDFEGFERAVFSKAMPLSKAVYTGLTGISPQAAEETLFRAGISPDITPSDISEDLRIHLFKTFSRLMEEVKDAEFRPCMIFKDKTPYDFSVLDYRLYDENIDCEKVFKDSVSKVLRDFYAQKSANTVMRQKSADLRRIVQTAIEREAKKLELQTRQLEDTEKRDRFRVYGELITTYGYSAEPGAKTLKTTDYYTGEEVTIPLDPELGVIENAKRYFDRYSKLKRTYEALNVQIVETKEALEYLKTVLLSLDIAVTENDLNQIKQELTDCGYIKFHLRKEDNGKKKQKNIKSEPLRFVSPEGVSFYVGKNNIQNEELTFGFASNNDWWFHAKGCPGSHVIMKCDGEIPDCAFEDAGALAAYFSSAASNGKVEVDYVRRKEVKKPANGKPGLVIYHTNYSLVAKADISRLTRIKDKT